MITAFVCLVGFAVLELWIIVIMAIWIHKQNKEIKELEDPLFPVEVEDG